MRNNSIRITCLGDISPIGIAEKTIISNIESVRKNLKFFFRESNLVIANLELPITSSQIIRENKKSIFKTNINTLKVFPENFIFSIANNHILDYGKNGLLDTIENLKKEGFLFTGAGKNIKEAGEPVILTVRNKKIGFFAAADKRYQAATIDSPGIFPAEINLLVPKIQKLKKQADIIYLSIHMGMEYTPVPTPAMKEVANQSHKAGADVVFFHHTHCLSGVTLKNKQATLWGLGNFIFPEKKNYSFKPWFETAAFHFTHSETRADLSLEIVPYKINEFGIPEKPDTATENKILARINSLSKKINSGKSLEKLRWKHILRPSYLQVALSNYADMARRQGLMQVFRQMASSVKVLFLKK